jgi:lysophospholipid hydrolase
MNIFDLFSSINITSPILWSTVTLFNTVLCILAIGFWTTNRQTQIKKSKSQQKPKKIITENNDTLTAHDSEDERDYYNDWTRYAERRNLVESMMLEDVDFDNDSVEASDDEDHTEVDGAIRIEERELKIKQRLHPGCPDRKKQADLFVSISKLKIFSYLSDDAFLLCLSLMEYVDLPEAGMDLFTDESPFDGSLYIVIDGKMDLTCSLSSPSACEEKPISLSAGPGDILTSILSTLCGLIEEYQKLKGYTTTRASKRIHAVNVKAKACENSTRLIRIPPSALVALLESYPQDIHQIAQTILARCQRVTIQTLVKNLGMGFEIMYSHGESNAPIEAEDMGDLPILFGQEKGEIDTLVQEINKTSTIKLAGDCSCPVDVNKQIMERLSRLVAGSLGSTEQIVIDILADESSIVMVKSGEIILPAESKSEYLYFVINGAIEVGTEKKEEYGIKSASYKDEYATKDGYFRKLYQVCQGDFIGAMTCFTDEVSFVTWRATNEGNKASLLFRVPKQTFQSLADKNSSILIQCVNKILTIDFSPLVHLFDWGIDWMHVQAGTLLAKKNETCNKMHVVLSGRLKAAPGSLGRHKEDEYGRGSCIGETYMLLGEEYPVDIFAVRNSELAVLPVNVLEYIMHVFPQTAVHFAKEIAVTQDQRKRGKNKATRGYSTLLDHNDISLATMAVVPLCFESCHEAHELSETISAALKKLAPTALITKSIAKKSVGSKVFNLRNAVHELKMSRLLGDLEESHRLTVYQTDQKFTWWTKLCIQQSDCVLLVVNAKQAPECAHLERYLAWAYKKFLVRHVQVLVLQQVEHDDNSSIEKRIPISHALSEWIESRNFIEGQHVVRRPIKGYEKDVARMCRRITGRSLGLALGGGGARGLAHVGVIRALMERGVSVDICGGTSQGAFVGGKCFVLITLCTRQQ